MKNVYDTGGAELINSLETLSASLFLNTTILITETLNGFNKNAPEDVFAAAAFAISDSELPVLSNQVEIRLYEI